MGRPIELEARGQWSMRSRFGVNRGMPYNWNTRQAAQPRLNRLPGGHGNAELPINNVRGTRGRVMPQAQRGFQK